MRRTLLALLPVLIAFIVQWMLWPFIQPWAWFLFFPGGVRTWLGGRRSGILSALMATVLVWYFSSTGPFFTTKGIGHGMATGVFFGMAIILRAFSTSGSSKRTGRWLRGLAAVRLANEQLEARVRERTAELAQSNETIRASSELFRVAFESSAVGMCQGEPLTGRLLRVNQRFCEMTGYSQTELKNRPFSELTHPADRAADLEKFVRFSRSETASYHAEKRYVRKDGNIIWVEVNASMVRDAHGNPLHSIAVVKDITERKQGEDALRESEEKYRSLFESMSRAFARLRFCLLLTSDRLITAF